MLTAILKLSSCPHRDKFHNDAVMAGQAAGIGKISIGAADFSEQGKLAALLIETLGAALQRESTAAARTGQVAADANDELMAADDFYFSNVELMNCCWFARVGGNSEEPAEIIGAACVNPTTAVLHFLVVRSAYRRQGIGKKLLAAAELAISRYRRKSLRVEIPVEPELDGAERFFAHCGYIRLTQKMAMGKVIG